MKKEVEKVLILQAVVVQDAVGEFHSFPDATQAKFDQVSGWLEVQAEEKTIGVFAPGHWRNWSYYDPTTVEEMTETNPMIGPPRLTK